MIGNPASLFVCSSCKSALLQAGQVLLCSHCEAMYSIHDGYVDMLDERAGAYSSPAGEWNDSFMEKKENEKKDYTLIAKSLEQAGVGRFAAFLNFGYVPDGSHSHAVFQPDAYSLNANSVRLLLEVIGEVDLNHKSVVDVGCGRGGNLTAMSKFYSPSMIAGIDICEANIVFCKSRKRLQNVSLIVGDAEQLPFADASFDIVLNIESAHAYPNRKQFYEEVYRVLKPNGVFLYTELLTADLLEISIRMLTQLGFAVTRNQNATSNVLLSCDDNAKQRAGAQGIASGQKLADTNMNYEIPEIKDFIAMPGSKKYNDMKNGLLEYRIMNLVKIG